MLHPFSAPLCTRVLIENEPIGFEVGGELLVDKRNRLMPTLTEALMILKRNKEIFINMNN